VDWATTQNLLIEGDNLEVLKLLKERYADSVKLIYIDPPYNTGKNFIYPDNFRDSVRDYRELAGQSGKRRKSSSDAELRGRFHAKWLNMMYPRLMLARELLSGDGVLFVNIDDTEAANLRKVLDEIFGEEQFIANVVWQKKYAPQNDATYFSDMHDHILVYAKQRKRTKKDPSGWSLAKLERTPGQEAQYKNPDSDPRGPWKSGDLSVKRHSRKYDYPIITPSGRVVHPPRGRCWFTSQDRMEELIADNRIWFGVHGSAGPLLKRFRSEVQDGIVPTTWWPYSEVGHNRESKTELKALMDGVSTLFDTPKPVRLMKRILHLATKHDPDALVMDFFAGSGTLGHAVMEMNQEDNGARKFILVQLPEPIDDPHFGTIADLTKERLRRAARKIKEEHPEWDGDTGFRVFKLSEPRT
jgi:adenine-specific DNA-methyltransferase